MPAAGEAGEEAAGRRRAAFWLKAAVSCALLGYLLWHGDLADLWGALRGAAPLWVAAAVGTYVTSHVVNAWRWRRYARQFGFHAGVGEFVRLYFAGLFVNLFMPGTIAGDLSRGLALGQLDGTRRRGAALGSVVAHRFSGLVALLGLAGLAAVVQRQVALPPLALAAAVALPLGAAASLMWAPAAVVRVAAWSGRKIDLPLTRASWASATAFTLAVACGYHALQIGAVVLLSRALDIGVAVTALALFVPLINMAGVVPVTFSGLGVREAGYVLSLGSLGVTSEQALALGLLGSGLVFAAGLAGALAFVVAPPPPAQRGAD